jgi:hypothetical protein
VPAGGRGCIRGIPSTGRAKTPLIVPIVKSADFLVLDPNPLDNITNTRKISSVYLRGAQIIAPPSA